MHLKQKGYCYGVLLVYTITAIALYTVGRCEPAAYSSQTNSHSDGAGVHNDRKARDDLTTKTVFYPSNRTARRRHHLDPRQREVARKVPLLQSLDSRDGSQSKTSASRLDLQRFKPRMASSSGKSFKNRDKEKQDEAEWTYSSFDRPNEDCSKGKIKNVISGKFYIADHIETSIPNVGYQSDSAQVHGGQVGVRGQLVDGPEQSWQRLEPEVECGRDAMTLTVRRRRAAQLLLDRVNTSSLPLSQLPSQCGYSVKTSWRDLSLMASYDACHVTQEDDSYVLPLLWRGTPVKMSCPVSQVQPQTLGPSALCCSPYGMTVTLQGRSATEELRVKVRGEWTPLLLLAQHCGYTLDKQAGELLIAAPFITCGVTVKDGKYTLSLQIGEKAVTLACPVSPTQTYQPLVDGPQHPTREPAEFVPETLQPFPWAPPFYLAPPYYPHPTYPHKYPSPDTHDGYNPPAPPSLTPNPTTRPQPLPHSESQPVYQEYYSYQMPPSESYQGFSVHSSPLSSTDETEDSNGAYPDMQQKQATSTSSHSENHSATQSLSSAAGFPDQAEAPSLQPPSHTFNPYYHYYHLPKIPLPDPVPEMVTDQRYPEEQPVPAPPNPEFRDQFPQPVTEAASRPPTLPVASAKLNPRAPAPHVPHPAQPYPYHYFYHLPHISTGEAKRLAPPNHVTVTTTSLPVDPPIMKPGTSAHPLPGLPRLPIHYKYNFHPYPVHLNPNHPYLVQPNPNHLGKPQVYGSLEWIPHPHLSEDDNEKTELEEVDKKKPSAPVVPATQPPLPPNYPHLYYHPHKSPWSNHQQEPNPITLPPPEQPSSSTPSPNHDPPPYPYYYHPYYHYYHMYYGPERSPNADHHASPSSSKEALDPRLQASASATVESPQRPVHLKHPAPVPDNTPDDNRPQTTIPTTEAYDVQNGPLHPYYYYYHHYYQPPVSIGDQEPHPAGSMYSPSKSETQLSSHSTDDTADSFVRAAEEGYPSMPQPRHEPFRSPSSHHISQQHPYDPFQHPNGEEAEERPDNEMKDRLKANSHPPAASPCGLGPVSDRDCSSLGCCSYPVNKCTMGHYFIFTVPDSVVEPTVAPPAPLSEVSNVSCTPQRLTSDPDLYTVPLDGCGVHTHMVGQTEVHLLDIQGIQPLQDHSSMHEGSPVRLLVECRSSPGSPGTVKFQVMDPSPAPAVQSTPATVTVQLRIATDESFTNFHPEAHLPLSLMQGRPVYVEVGLLNPPQPGLVLLVHYCLAYTYSPYASWMLIYNGCPSSDQTSHLLPPPPPSPSHPHHTRRLTITSFLSLPTESSSHLAKGGYSHLEDPEIYFLCSTEVCSGADGDCTVGCISSPESDV